jgi:hypothetical protein
LAKNYIHINLYDEYEDEDDDDNILLDEEFVNEIAAAKNSPKWRKITECLIEFVVATNQAISIVDNIFFQNLVFSLDSTYKMPCRQTLKNIQLKELKSKISLKIQNELNLALKVSFTCDHWTSASNDPYLGFTIHYINSRWQLSKHVLGLLYTENDHTSENIFKQIEEVLIQWKIQNKVDFFSSFFYCKFYFI